MTKRMHDIEDVDKRDRKGELDYLEGLSRKVENDQDLNKLKLDNAQKVLKR